MSSSLQLGPRVLWRVAVMTALTKGRIPVLWIGFSQKRELPVDTGRSKACDMQSGSRSSKKLLASSLTQALSCGWRKDAYEPQISAAEVSDTGMGLCGAQAPPRWHWSGFPVAGLQEEKAALYSAGRISGWKALRLRGTPRTLGFQAYPPPPWVQQGLFKILQQSPQKTQWSVFPVQVWVPPGLLRWRWFTAWTKSLSCILTWECVSKGLYLSETLAGSWAQQLQTAVTCTSSSLNPSVTHLSCLPQIGHKQLLLQFWKPFLYFTIILLQVIYFSTQFFQLVSQSKPELFRLFHTNTAALL